MNSTTNVSFKELEHYNQSRSKPLLESVLKRYYRMLTEAIPEECTVHVLGNNLKELQKINERLEPGGDKYEWNKNGRGVKGGFAHAAMKFYIEFLTAL